MKISLISSIIFATCILSMPVSAQDGPSYEETVIFLQEKLNTSTQRSAYSTLEYFVELDHCEFAIVHTETRPSQNRVSLYSPALFDPDLVRVEGRSRVTTTSKRSRKVIPNYDFASEAHLLDDGSSMSEYALCNEVPEYSEMFQTEEISSLLTIPTDDRYCAVDEVRNGPRLGEFLIFLRILPPGEANAPRVANALKHLIRLCGGG